MHSHPTMNAKFNALLTGIKHTKSGTTITTTYGKDDFTPSVNGTGDITLTRVEGSFRRVPVVLATAGADGILTQVVSSTVSATNIVTADSSASATDSVLNAIIYGWDNSDTNNAAVGQKVRCTQLSPRLIPLVFSDPDSITEGDYRVTATAASNVTTITFKQAFQTPPIIVGSPDTAGNVISISTVTNQTAIVKQVNSSGSASTNGMHLWVLGYDNANPIGKRKVIMEVAQKQPRMIFGRITLDAGTPSITGYSDMGVVSDNGTGDFTLTFAKPFLRAPVVVASMSSLGSVAVTEVSTTACRLVCQTNAGAAVDPTTVHVGICGFDSTLELG